MVGTSGNVSARRFSPPGGGDIPEPTADGTWNLAWSNEFDSDTIDTGSWNVGEFQYGSGGTNNHNSFAREDLCYIHDDENWLVLDSEFEGSPRSDHDNTCDGNDYWDEHGVGAMHTYDKVTFGYDSHDVVMALIRPADLPESNTAWWTVANVNNGQTWPPEIDMVEFMSDRDDEASINLHMDTGGVCGGSDNPDNGTYTHNERVARDFHLIEFEWEPGSHVSYHVDQNHARTVTDQGVLDGLAACDSPHCMILNMGIEDNWSPGDDCSKAQGSFPPWSERGQVPHGDQWDQYKTTVEVAYMAKWTHA